MPAPTIETPRGSIIVTKNGKAELKFDSTFQQKWQARYSMAQKFMDSEVLRLCDKYVPMQTGMLIKSGILGTDIGSGTVAWIAPYARTQYYLPRKKPGSQTGPLRGSQWFERMKAVYRDKIVAGAKQLAGRG